VAALDRCINQRDSEFPDGVIVVKIRRLANVKRVTGSNSELGCFSCYPIIDDSTSMKNTVSDVIEFRQFVMYFLIHGE